LTPSHQMKKGKASRKTSSRLKSAEQELLKSLVDIYARPLVKRGLRPLPNRVAYLKSVVKNDLQLYYRLMDLITKYKRSIITPHESLQLLEELKRINGSLVYPGLRNSNKKQEKVITVSSTSSSEEASQSSSSSSSFSSCSSDEDFSCSESEWTHRRAKSR